MNLHTAYRKQTKTRLALMGYSGTGKTYSALLLAYGITGDWSKIALIDTEEESASLYSHLGPFSTIQIGAPYHPSRLVEAIDLCESSGMEVIILDSLSPEWNGPGGIVDRLGGPYYQDALREHRTLLNRIGTNEAHIICTMHSKQKLVRVDREGRRTLQLLERPIQQEGIAYRFTTVLRLDMRHRAHVVKDRTGLFASKEPAPLETDHGIFVRNWCGQGVPAIPDDLQQRIDSCRTVEELHCLVAWENLDVSQISAFTRRRIELEQGCERSVITMFQGGAA